jgi:hypothetical protein
MFENIAIEDLDACINSEVQAGVSEVGVLWRSCALPFSQCHWTVNDVDMIMKRQLQ